MAINVKMKDPTMLCGNIFKSAGEIFKLQITHNLSKNIEILLVAQT